MVLLDSKTGGPAGPRASFEFDSDIAVLTHSTTIAPRYQVGRCANSARSLA